MQVRIRCWDKELGTQTGDSQRRQCTCLAHLFVLTSQKCKMKQGRLENSPLMTPLSAQWMDCISSWTQPTLSLTFVKLVSLPWCWISWGTKTVSNGGSRAQSHYPLGALPPCCHSKGSDKSCSEKTRFPWPQHFCTHFHAIHFGKHWFPGKAHNLYIRRPGF